MPSFGQTVKEYNLSFEHIFNVEDLNYVQLIKELKRNKMVITKSFAPSVVRCKNALIIC